MLVLDGQFACASLSNSLLRGLFLEQVLLALFLGCFGRQLCLDGSFFGLLLLELLCTLFGFELPLLLLGDLHSLLFGLLLFECTSLSLGLSLLLSGDFFLGRSIRENLLSIFLGFNGAIVHQLFGFIDFLLCGELLVIRLILDVSRHDLVGLSLLTDLLNLISGRLANGHHGGLLGLLQISRGLGQSLGFLLGALLSFFLVFLVLSDFGEPGMLFFGLSLGLCECLLPLFGGLALLLLSFLLLSGLDSHLLTDTLGLCLFLRDLLLLLSLLFGKLTLLFLEFGELLLLIRDRVGLGFKEVHCVVTFRLHDFLKLSLLLLLLLLGKCHLMLLLLLLFIGNLLLEFDLLLLCQLLELSEMLNRSAIIIDDVFVFIDWRIVNLLGQCLNVDPVRICLIGDILLDRLVHLGDHAPNVFFAGWVVVILLQADCAMLHRAQLDASDGVGSV